MSSTLVLWAANLVSRPRRLVGVSEVFLSDHGVSGTDSCTFDRRRYGCLGVQCVPLPHLNTECGDLGVGVLVERCVPLSTNRYECPK